MSCESCSQFDRYICYICYILLRRKGELVEHATDLDARARKLGPAAAVSRTLSLAAAAAAASEMPSPAAAAPTRDRRPRLQACATLGAHSTLLPRPRSALYSTRRSRHLIAASLRAALNGPAPTLTLMPLTPVCPAGLKAQGRASTVRVPRPALIPGPASSFLSLDAPYTG